jgi:MurNAc alpha-1-phosphate uridylyltransferase
LYSPQFFINEPAGKQTMLPLFKKAIIADTISAEHYTGEWYDVGTLACWQKLNERLNGTTLQCNKS